MDQQIFCNKINLQGKVIGIKRMTTGTASDDLPGGCKLKALNRVFQGETIIMCCDSGKCKGGNTGFGLYDGLPNIPGGFGYFLSAGRGAGFPPGEKVKQTPEIGEKMLLSQPQQVMNGNEYIRLKPYEDGDDCDTVTMLVNPDQLATLVHIFNFRKSAYDNVIAPMVSGCASIFRIPFGELKREQPRGVIGNMDVFSRPHFEANTFFFTVAARDFEQMLEDAEQSVITSPIFKAIGERLKL